MTQLIVQNALSGVRGGVSDFPPFSTEPSLASTGIHDIANTHRGGWRVKYDHTEKIER